MAITEYKIKKIFKVQEAVMEGFRKASQELGCTEIFTPTISASSTEGGADVFKVDYYDKKAFLVQSPQLYKQMLVPVFERVYLISHAYRSEPSVTTRHLSESIQMDCELGYVDFDELFKTLNEIVVNVESFGQMNANNIFTKAIEVLKKDLDEIAKKIK